MAAASLFARFNRLKAIVIGDVMIDSYLWGKAERLSPEAPVPIVHVRKRESRLGGAANVALNLLSLGATPFLCAVVGDDPESQQFARLLQAHKLTNQGIISCKNRPTTVKHRILADSQQMLRVDSELTTPISEKYAEEIFKNIYARLPETDVLIFEDYDKGVLSPSLIGRIIEEANRRNIPTVVDPKKRNFLAYTGCTLFKPNLKELKDGIQAEIGTSIPEIAQAIEKLQRKMPCENVMVTLSEQGIYIGNARENHHIAAHLREITDVSGAGDTVVSIAALGLAAGLGLKPLAALANLGGGLVCESPGVVPINKQKLLAEAEKHLGKERLNINR